MGEPPAAPPSASLGRTLVLVALAFATIPLLVGTTVAGFTFLIVPIVAITAVVAYGFRGLTGRVSWAVPALALVSLAIGVVSVLTGRLNGLSDEPASTPAYASLGWALYTQPVHFTYLQYGVPRVEQSYYVYLPLLTWIQVPGLDYRWVSLAAWGAAWYALRNDPFARAGWSVPWIPLLAANGQNDFVPLLALTLALAVPIGRWKWAAEVIGLALKQFANVLFVGYHLFRREYLRAAVAAAVTVAFLAPFLWIDPGAVYCHAILGDPTNACAAHSAGFVVFKRNYWLYPTWVGLVFVDPIVRWLRRALGRIRPHVA